MIAGMNEDGIRTSALKVSSEIIGGTVARSRWTPVSESTAPVVSVAIKAASLCAERILEGFLG
jgi:hypothetical protein